MDIDYNINIWNGLHESFVMKLLEKTYRNLDYSVTNFHRTDRAHENGIDLLCQKNEEQIAIQVKMKPVKADAKQFNHFEQNTRDSRPIYVYIRNPTRSFWNSLRDKLHRVEFLDANGLHNFLLENESIEYCCLYFSKHPLILSLLRVHQHILEKRRSKYVRHTLTREELAKLWAAKDNAVKAWVPLHFTYLRWTRILMAKTEKNREEFRTILESIFKEFDSIYSLCGDKLVSSINDLSIMHPDLIGLMWNLISQRTNWITYTSFIDHKTQSLEQALFFTMYCWICPVFNESKQASMSGFYSAMNYLLENFADVAKDIEAGIDWVFDEATTADS